MWWTQGREQFKPYLALIVMGTVKLLVNKVEQLGAGMLGRQRYVFLQERILDSQRLPAQFSDDTCKKRR